MTLNQRLKNLFNWSASRESTFRDCQKKYWYTYYGSWDGWPLYYNDPRGKSLDPLAAHLYMLKNMQTVPIFLGSMVHSVIETTLKTIHSSRVKQLPELKTLLSEVEQKMRKGVEESMNGAWKRHPKKHTHFLEHYYNFPMNSEAFEEAIVKAQNCIENWYHSPSIQNIAMSPRATWKEIEKAMNFEIEPGISAIVVFDFSLTWQRKESQKEEITMIFDWKTGQESQKIEEQMYAYAIAAQKELQIPLENLLIVPFYLAQSTTSYKKIGAGQVDELCPKKITEIEKKIVSSSREMIALHQVNQNEMGASLPPDPTLFTYSSDEFHCKRCPFKEVCEKANFQQISITELRNRITC